MQKFSPNLILCSHFVVSGIFTVQVTDDASSETMFDRGEVSF